MMEIRCLCGGEALVQMVIACSSHIAHDYRFCFECAEDAIRSSAYSHPECGTNHVLNPYERKTRFL